MCGNSRALVAIILFLFFTGLRAEPSSSLASQPDPWTPAENSQPATLVEGSLAFPCTFSETTDRYVWDAKLDFSPADADGLELDVEFLDPDLFRAVTIYIRSGPGWYAASFPSRQGRHRVWLPFARFETLDAPDAWKNASQIRVSPWKASVGHSSLLIHSLQPRVSALAIIRPGPGSSPDLAERTYGLGLATTLSTFFTELSLPAAELSDDGTEDLSRYRLLILPYNPHPSPALLRRLESALRRGSRLMVFYNHDKALGKLAGVEPQPWVQASSPGRWMSMIFPAEIWGHEFRVFQRETPHLLPALPGKNARVAAWWENRDGQRQSEPALLLSPSAAWFTAPFHPEDENGKQRMLAFTADTLSPGLAQPAIEARIRNLRNEALSAADERIPRISTLVGEQKFADAWNLSEQIRADAWLRAGPRPLPPGGMRGIWDHRGDGLHAGRWDISMAELSAADFTDLFLFVSRKASLPTAAIAAGAKQGLSVHAWHICWNLYDAPTAERERLERSGRLQISASGVHTPWLCPANEANRRMERDRLLRLADTPGLLGIHLDYIRFPDADHCYCPTCHRAFEKTLGRELSDWPAAVLAPGDLRSAFLQWRADTISFFVRDLSTEVRAKHPGILLSAAVWPDYPEIVNRLGQDWPLWLREGWIDFAVPMCYSPRVGEVVEWTQKQRAAAGQGKRIITGIGVTAAESRLMPPLVLEQIHAAREAGADGFVLFDLNETLRVEMFPVMRILKQEKSDD